MPALIAVDWGTTNRRVYAVETDGTVSHRDADGQGILSVAAGGFAGEVDAIRRQYPGVPVLMAGMVGSDRGWANVPYVPCPADLDALAQGMHWMEPGAVGIVPGVSYRADTRADVMRGEEVQYLGALAAGDILPDGIACHPGTHVKWAELANGCIQRFRTVMSGELFALLQKHSILSGMIADDSAEPTGPAFLAGVAHGFETPDLAAELFQVRARVLLGALPKADASPYVSGLLVGDDLRIGLGRGRADVVPVIGAPHLTALYAAALTAIGRTPQVIDGEAAFIAGIRALAEKVL